MKVTIAHIRVITLVIVALAMLNCSKKSSDPSTSCSSGYYYTSSGCLPTSYGYGTYPGTPGSPGYPGYPGGTAGGFPSNGAGSPAMCQGQCQAGAVQTSSGCLPQYTCMACYAFANGTCYQGTYAHAYYGY